MLKVALEAEAEADRSRRSNRQAGIPNSCSLQSGRAVGYSLTDNFKGVALPRRGLPERT
jgi:hypothetical protein